MNHMLNVYHDEKKKKKRTLKKVRWEYIRKFADPNDPGIIDPASWLLNNNTIYVIRPELLLFEKNRQVQIDVHQLSSRFHITTQIHESRHKAKVLDVNFEYSDKNKENWEYTLKRLESFGDLDLAAWAHKIKEYDVNHSKLMKEYFNLVQSKDQNARKLLENMQIKAKETIKDLEENYSFTKLLIFSGEESAKLLALSYNEEFLNYTGFTTETVSEWIKANGAPALFEARSLPYASVASEFLNPIKLEKGPIYLGPEFEADMKTKDEQIKKVAFKYIKILEPRENGFFLHDYYIIDTWKMEQGGMKEGKNKLSSKMKKESTFKDIMSE